MVSPSIPRLVIKKAEEEKEEERGNKEAARSCKTLVTIDR
jgi:hypothetical protein